MPAMAANADMWLTLLDQAEPREGHFWHGTAKSFARDVYMTG